MQKLKEKGIVQAKMISAKFEQFRPEILTIIYPPDQTDITRNNTHKEKDTYTSPQYSWND